MTALTHVLLMDERVELLAIVEYDPLWPDLFALEEARLAKALGASHPDDERTDPAGNSGPRVVCGVIKRSR